MLESLTKENFWDALYEQYPDGMKVFCDWIDKYKAENNWEFLFNGEVHHTAYNGFQAERVKTKAPKFHNLPFAMQIGIYIEFCVQRGGCSWQVDLLEINWKEEITGMIKLINEQENTSDKEPAAIQGLKMLIRDLSDQNIEIIIKKREGRRILGFNMSPKSSLNSSDLQLRESVVKFVHDLRNVIVGEITTLERELNQ
jgi:hypothetical protein